jgi:hypothetical protein
MFNLLYTLFIGLLFCIAYGDIGDMESTCVDCGALIWFQERANKDRGKLVIKVFMCCK